MTNSDKSASRQKLPPEEIQVQIKAIEAGFTLMTLLKRDTDRRIAEINTEYAFNRLTQMIYDYFKVEEAEEEHDCPRVPTSN